MERSHHGASQDSSGYRTDGRPPSGRTGSRSDRPSLPMNYDSLPPRFKKKYEEDRLLQSMTNSDRVPPLQVMNAAGQSGQPKDSDRDNSLRTFLNATGPPVRPTLPHPFPQPTSPNAPSAIRPQLWTPGSRSISGGRPPARSQQMTSDHEDADMIYARPRSQDSMSGGFSDHGRERKTSVTDSRSSTPSSSVDCTSGQHLLRGTSLRRVTLRLKMCNLNYYYYFFTARYFAPFGRSQCNSDVAGLERRDGRRRQKESCWSGNETSVWSQTKFTTIEWYRLCIFWYSLPEQADSRLYCHSVFQRNRPAVWSSSSADDWKASFWPGTSTGASQKWHASSNVHSWTYPATFGTSTGIFSTFTETCRYWPYVRTARDVVWSERSAPTR